jgi:uncharacterized integral membrane protein
MRLLSWAVRLALFVLLLAFAAKNTDPVALRFFFDASWQIPLAVLLFAFFAGGVLLGLAAAALALLRQRREIGRLARASGGTDAEPPAGAPPRPAEG